MDERLKILDLLRSRTAGPVGSGRKNLCNEISRTLRIPREASYRRMRGDVEFRFSEIVKLANEFGFSLDSFTGQHQEQKSLMEMVGDPQDTSEGTRQKSLLARYVDILGRMGSLPAASIAYCCTTAPFPFYLKYDRLTDYFGFKSRFMHQDDSVCFSETTTGKEIRDAQKEVVRMSEQVGTSVFVLRRDLMDGIVSDIRYFLLIGMITKTEKDVLCGELKQLLNELEEITALGVFPQGGKVTVYVPDIHFNADFLCTGLPGPPDAADYTNDFCLVHTTEAAHILGQDTKSCAHFQTFMQALMKNSTIISECAIKNRRRFFDQQLACVEGLLSEKKPG